MKTLKFNTGSLHYKLANMGSTYDPPDNICSYTWAVVRGLFWSSVIALFGTGFLALTAETGVGLYFAYLTGSMEILTELAKAGLIVWIALSIVFLIGTVAYLFAQRAERIRLKLRAQGLYEKPKADNFIANGYRSFKEKFCVQLEFVGKK
jgi:hypothetical protein